VFIILDDCCPEIYLPESYLPFCALNCYISAYASPINSINSGSFPGSPTISTSKITSAFAGIRGFPAEAGRPLGPNARLPYIIVGMTKKKGGLVHR